MNHCVNTQLHLNLCSVQLIHHLAKGVIELVELLQPLIHSIRFLFHSCDLIFTRTNISLKLFDLMVQHELKLLEFLRPLLQLIDLPLLLSDCLITIVDLLLLLIDGFFQLFILLL